MEIARLTACKNFVGKRDKFIFYAFVDLKTMQRFEMGVICLDLGALTTARAIERVLDLLKPVKLTVWKVVNL